jgi:alkylation response protein AidB-like acyl-CoA dehydrogenase
MNFDLPESHREIQRMVRELGARLVAPHARSWDEAGVLPTAILADLAAQGLLAVRAPDAYGGSGLDALALTLVVEELARYHGSLAYAVAAHNGLGVAHLALAGSDALRERTLPGSASEDGLVAWLDDGVMAKRAGDGWTLHGTAPRVVLGATARRIVVAARTVEGPTAFVVDRDAVGLRVSRRVETLGMRACESSDLSFEACAVADDARVGEVGAAADATVRVRAGYDLALAALAVGCGQGALDAAVAYAKDRKQFGQPIANFQAIQWMLADARVELDAARLLVQRAAATDDAGGDARIESATARLYASEAASRACSRALQVHGGYGYTREFPVERHLRDVKVCELGDGGNAGRRAVVAATARPTA